LDGFLVGLGVSSLLDCVVEFVPGLFQLALDKLDFLIDLGEADARFDFLTV